MTSMVGWSFGIGRIFGVGVRLHLFFVFLLVPLTLWAGALGRSPARGFGLFGLMLLAVLVREVARALMAAWFYLDVKTLLLLPTGALLTYAGAESETRAGEGKVQRSMAMAGPLANLVFGLVVAGLVLTVLPNVRLMELPWITPAHLLRSLIWVNVLLGCLNLLPVWPLDGGRVLRGEFLRMHAARSDSYRGGLQDQIKVFATLNWGVALGLVVFGTGTQNWWSMLMGVSVWLGGQVSSPAFLPEGDKDGTKVRDVMLTDYSMLPSSATLEDAMMEARHSLQDVFPVVRGGNMVGAVGRQSILDALAGAGNGYVQGIMTRTFHTATPDDLLLEALNRAVVDHAGGPLQIVPVVDGESVVGILTPQHLHRSLGLLPRMLRSSRRAASEDGTK